VGEGAAVSSGIYHPTTISLRYSARAVLHLDGEVDEIIPGPIYGSGSEVWLASTKNYRNWLTESDIDPLRDLVNQASFILKNMPPRLSRAMWYHEYASRIEYIDVRWTLICTGLESLVKTDRHGSTKQFKTRLIALAVELGVPLTDLDADTAYDYRSGLVHGQGLPPVNKISASIDEDPRTDLYTKCETVLRAAILRALRAADFRAIFSDDDAIRKRWPV